MKTPTMKIAALCALALGVSFTTAHADTFGTGPNTFTLDFVNIGNAGNTDDTGLGGGIYSSLYGGVPYAYRIGTFEISQDQITRATASGLANVTAGPHTANEPAAFMTWYEAAAFVNWLNTSTGHQAAYQLDIGLTTLTPWASVDAWQAGGENLYRHKDAYYFLPSEDEWYKAAYHQNDGVSANYWDYATGSNAIPTQALSDGTLAGSAVFDGPEPGTPADPGDVLWSSDERFILVPIGQLDAAKNATIFSPMGAVPGNTVPSNGSIVEEDGERFLRHRIPAGALGIFDYFPQLARETEHATLEQTVRFDDNFDWRWGGKVGFGLLGVVDGQVPWAPGSCNPDRDIGFSTRLMWHGNGDDNSRPFSNALGELEPGLDNEIVTYLYTRSPRGDGFNDCGYGIEQNPPMSATRGVWHKIKLEVKLNTVGQDNGVYKLWWDDQLRIDASNFNYRNRADLKIQMVFWDFHRGGSVAPSWVSARDTYIDVKNVVVTDLQ